MPMSMKGRGTSTAASLSAAAVDRAHKPTLKRAGKSDCLVSIIRAENCQSLPPDLTLNAPSVAGWTTPRPAGSTPLAQPSDWLSDNGSDGYFASGDEEDEEDVFSHVPIGLDQVRKFTSHMWAVRKTAFCEGKQDGTRLVKQILKQSKFGKAIESNPRLLAGVSTPTVYSIYDDDAGNKVVEMAYVPYGDTLEIILQGDRHTFDWISRTVLAIINYNLSQSQLRAYHSVAQDFTKKAEGILDACASSSSLLSPSETAEVGSLLRYLISDANANMSDTLLPIGMCHGDLTLQNMLWDGSRREMAVFDFLDCFVESPLQDVAKLFQDIRYYWFFTQTTVRPDWTARILSSMALLEQQVVLSYGNASWWPLMPLFEAFCLARVLPYVTKTEEKVCILLALRRLQPHDRLLSLTLPTTLSLSDHDAPSETPSLLNATDGSHRALLVARTPAQPVKIEGKAVTLIVTALGKEGSDIFPDGNPKWFTIHHSGLPMIVECMSALDLSEVAKVYIVLPQALVVSHYTDPNLLLAWFDALGEQTASKITLVLFNRMTRDVVETVTETIKLCHIRGPIFIKDADNQFSAPIRAANTLTYVNLVGNGDKNAPGGPSLQGVFDLDRKSFATFMYDNILANIFEKTYLSSIVCVGGWSFMSAKTFVKAAWALRASGSALSELGLVKCAPLRISDIVFKMLISGTVFFGVDAQRFSDWGSLAAWRYYSNLLKTRLFSADNFILRHFIMQSSDVLEPRVALDELMQALKQPTSSVVVFTKFPQKHLTRVRTCLETDPEYKGQHGDRLQFLYNYHTDEVSSELLAR